MIIKGFRYIPSRVAVIAIIGSFFLFNGFNAIPVSAASNISVSNSGKVSFGKVSASSTGTLATGEDTLNITTDCEAGANVYTTSVNGSSTGTSLINLAAKEQDESSNGGTGVNPASYTITTSSSTISSPGSLENNTWGLNVINNNTYYGLPEYSASGLPTVIYSGTNTELPIYYGAKVTNSLTPGTYTGEVLYTVTVNNSCLDYIVKFNKNADDATGDMSDQSILPTGGTLSENSFTYSGYTFLGWSLDPAGKTGTATNGIGTAEDVDFEDKASFPGSNEGILPGSETTLYAIWEEKPTYMQNWFGCAKMQQNEIVALTDSRDNQEYLVKKLPDGNCWMIQNLTLGSKGGVELTSSDTNIPNTSGGTAPDASNKYYLPPAGHQGAINNVATKTSQTAVDFSTSNDAQAKVAYISKNSTNHSTGTPAPENTGYYNFYTVTLGYSYYGDTNITSGTSPRDICPKGWRLPWSSNSGNTFQGSAELYKLALTYNGNSSVWSNYIAPTSTGTTYPYTSDATVFRSLVFGNSGSLNPMIDTNGAAGFTYVGRYEGQALKYVGQMGIYWSSSIYNNEEGYRLHFDTSSIKPQLDYNKFLGSAVRCISQYPNVTGYMQDFNTNDLASGESTALLDKRDNSEYTVKKFGTGDDTEVWMTQNLVLGHDKGYTLTSADTNIPDNTTYYLPPAGKRGSVTSSSTVTATNTATFNTSNVSEAQVQYRAAGQAGDTNSTGTLFQNTGYYNYPAATLGYSYYNDGLSSGDAPRDICPKGWQLPRGSSTSTYSFYWLDTTLGGTGANRYDTTTRNKFLNDASFGYSGYYDSSQLYNVGSAGLWWSSTLYSSAYAYYMLLNSGGYVYPQNNDNKYSGFSVRCIAKESYTINYNTNGGTGEMAPSKGYIGGGTVLSRNTFTKDGYYFIGWSTNPSATTATYSDGATISTDLAPAGGSITLYAVWSAEDPSVMQTSNVCQYVPEGQTVNLKDSRDNQEYSVYHIPSNATYPSTSTVANVANKCIMTKDLNLGAVASVEGSASTIVANGAMTLSPEDSNFTTPTGGSGESITVPTTSVSITNGSSSWSSTDSYSNKQYTTSGTGYYANRGYYSWGAAMTVCPKGWRLPTQDEYNNNDSSWNASTTGISKLVNNNISTIQSSPWSFVLGGSYGGSFSGAGSYGSYWSSAQYSSTRPYYLLLHSSSGLLRDNSLKYFGFAVRCIAD